MRGRKKWNVDLLSGDGAAAALLFVLFLLGSILGCVAAGMVDPGHGPALLRQVRGCLAAEGLRFSRVLWQTVRFPLAVIVFGFTAFGVAGLPLLFLARGFLACYAASLFYRFLGFPGMAFAFVLFGLGALIWLPACLHLGAQGMVSAYGLLRRAFGDGRYPLHLRGAYFIRSGVCAALLCVCAAAECFLVPLLLQSAAALVAAG